MTGYPVQPSKVQRPSLRAETLARGRLLDWLGVKVHHRVVFVTAEAGYGKTTLLADFSRRTRLRTLWYRLDAEDRGWIAFLSHLVAAGREYDPGFAPKTFGLLGEIGIGGPSRDSVVQTFLRELPPLGEQGAALILDDFHAVDDSEIRDLLGVLLARAPERMSFVFSSRRTPSLRVARLRALGEVAELTTDDLRFNDVETERLFRETYGQPLEPDVLDDLSRRTDGWAASLQLVQAAIRHRSAGEIRTFVRSISGAEGALYDYLAEEVVGELPEDLQDFLMRTSLLESLDESLAALTTGLSKDEASSRILQLERAGLLGRRGDAARGGALRFHPLVREFLQQRLLRSVGEDEVRRTHLRIAHGADRGWKLAAHHFAEANEAKSVHEALQAATLQIMGSGDYELAASYSKRFPLSVRNPKYEVVQSRVDFRRGDLAGAIARARSAYAEAPESDDALANLVGFEVIAGDLKTAVELAKRLEARTPDTELSGIASATVALLEASFDLDLPSAMARLDALADQQRAAGHLHYEGISLLNSAVVARSMGDADGALVRSTRAIELLEASSAGWEVAGAQTNRAWALMHLGRFDEGLAQLDTAVSTGHAMARAEALIDAGLIQAFYGSLINSAELLQEASLLLGTAPNLLQDWLIASAHNALRAGAASEAASLVERFQIGGLAPTPGQRLHQLVIAAHLATLTGSDEEAVQRATQLADKQRSPLLSQYLWLLQTFRADASTWDRAIARTLRSSPAHATILAELAAERLNDLSSNTLDALRTEAHLRPVRWQSALRIAVDRAGPSRLAAARLLDEIGAPEDIARLRSIARGVKSESQLGKQLARRLAPKVVVEDQGRVAIFIGSRVVVGALCFLLSRPDFSATRDQVLDALWPDLDPDVALNSLNQTVYFLRRVFEPEYKEDLSPEYLHHDSDVLWLDRALVSARSADCWTLVRAASTEPAPAMLDRLSETYRGRFALDFAYEDWAAAYRDGLHASYLQLIEAAVIADVASGHFDRAIRLARRALEVDPQAEELELTLLRLYRQTGARSAAAEQYAHYAAAIRSELGIEPPPLDAL